MNGIPFRIYSFAIHSYPIHISVVAEVADVLLCLIVRQARPRAAWVRFTLPADGFVPLARVARVAEL